ncbi:Fumarylacetoacetate (FAA) hydrolase family protein [Enhygromyxa salina]|uniref:Fumarylacetoacetate (FAA) hydrolase family protein n=1 Tax=Enhygromyxa salina TaxID=215803 RepID=A0A2S9XF90_9BACT|nr:fumarylacetoacetate hydrolase family protein [Enhygromyxa salina]PRP91534.1 Fumarylacetoacetate (FAA) hydrolase family protein [Enhygromyxa salina]
MIPSEQGNRSKWSGHGFEIWFFVVLMPGVERALWVRFTRFANGEQSDARVWAVVSEDGGVTQARDIVALDEMRAEGGDGEFHVRVAAAELGHGFSRGSCGRIRWDLSFEATDPLIERMPKLPRFVPVGTHAHQPHSEAAVTGWVELDGRRMDLDGGLFTQMHLWGHQRVEWLRWAWAPRFVGHEGELQLTAVAAKADGPNLCALWARIDDEIFDHSGLTRSTRAQVETIRAGVVHHLASSAGRRLVVRVWAPPATFAGWDYRKIGAGDLHIAQTNLARAELELYRRAGLGWVPVTRARSTCAALEFHGPEDFEEFAIVPWDARDAEVRERPAASVEGQAEPPGPGQWIDTPKPSQIIALGLTYKAHAKETASKPDAVVFEIDASAWSAGGGALVRPSSSRLRAGLAALDPTLAEGLAEFGFIPAMLDYEVELGVLLLDGLADPSGLDALADSGRVALVVANDVSARSVQILGEGQADRLAYWTAAKSLPGFAPTSARAWIPERFELDLWPALRLETRVNGVVRQDAALDLLVETPRQMLARVCAQRGPLAPGTLVLTGTPAGVAFSVPRWKRAIGERLLDRVGKLRAALTGFSATTDFLRPGDVVSVRAGFLGGFELEVQTEPEG